MGEDEVLYRGGKSYYSIESWGTGIQRMFSSCREYGIREPELLEIGDSFRVNLYRPSYSEVQQSTPESIVGNFNKTQQKIIEIILKDPKVTQAEIADQLEITIRAIKKSMKEIVDAEILMRVGPNKGGYWEVKINKK